MPTLETLAKSIVRDSLRAKEYEPVVITTYPHTMELATEVALECQKAGADPLIVLDTDELFYGQFKNYSLENLGTSSAHCLGIAEYTRSYISFGGPKDPAPMSRVPQEKLAAVSRSEEAHHAIYLKKRHKCLNVDLGLVTRERAKTYGFSHAKWKAMTESAIAANYRQIAEFGKIVAGVLSSPVDVRINGGNGTDLRFTLAGPSRKAYVDDGVISDEDIAEGSAETGLPTGSVWIAPVENSANGTFVADVPIPQAGKLIEGLSWSFSDGRLTDFSAKKNLKSSQIGWEDATGDRDVFGIFGLGLNKKARLGFLKNYIVSGAVTVGIGENQGLGGSNQSSYEFVATHGSATVEIAGKTVIDRGKWVI